MSRPELKLDASDYVHQFLLAEHADIGPESWAHRQLGGWHLRTHPALPVIDVVDPEGNTTGWILGWPIDVEARSFAASGYCLPPDDLESHLYELGGRWLAVLVDAARIYLNATGELPCVFSPTHRMVASTTALLPPSPDTEEHRSLRRTLDIPASDHFYPLGLTAHPRATRLVPNHVLDLQTFDAPRHWPGPDDLSEGDEAGTATAIAALGAAHADAIAEQFPLQGNLTAGVDTRLMLALARTHAGSMTFMTRDSPSYKDSIDTSTARQLAERFGLDLNVVVDIAASDDALTSWQERTGSCIAGSVWRSIATWAQADPSRANLPGMAGEVARAKYSTRGVNVTSAEAAAPILALPSHPLLTEAAARWLDEVPAVSARVQLDLLYVEQRVGCWAAPTLYGNTSEVPSFWLLSHRDIMRRMLNLSVEHKRTDQLAIDVIGHCWPELLDVPFNTACGPDAMALRMKGLRAGARRVIPYMARRIRAARR